MSTNSVFYTYDEDNDAVLCQPFPYMNQITSFWEKKKKNKNMPNLVSNPSSQIKATYKPTTSIVYDKFFNGSSHASTSRASSSKIETLNVVLPSKAKLKSARKIQIFDNKYQEQFSSKNGFFNVPLNNTNSKKGKERSIEDNMFEMETF